MYSVCRFIRVKNQKMENPKVLQPAYYRSSFTANKPGWAGWGAANSQLGIALPQHRGEASRLLLSAFSGAWFFEAPMQADLKKGLFAVHFLFEPPQGLLHRLSSFECDFSHI
jgi:hypothetical protein